MNIIYTKTAIKVINSLDRSTKQRLKTVIMELTEIPPIGDIKQVKDFQYLPTD